MSLEDGLYKQLTTATLTTHLGSTAIFPILAPKGRRLPYVTYQQISETRIQAMGSDPGLQMDRYQISSWSSDYNQVKAISDAVRYVLQRFSGSLGGTVTIQEIFFDNEVDLFDIDPQTRKATHHVAQDYLIWYST